METVPVPRKCLPAHWKHAAQRPWSEQKALEKALFRQLKNACGGGIKLTTAKYYLPNGECIHKKGINPDETIEYEKKDTDTEKEDTQLQHALQIIEQ